MKIKFANRSWDSGDRPVFCNLRQLVLATEQPESTIHRLERDYNEIQPAAYDLKGVPLYPHDAIRRVKSLLRKEERERERKWKESQRHRAYMAQVEQECLERLGLMED